MVVYGNSYECKTDSILRIFEIQVDGRKALDILSLRMFTNVAEHLIPGQTHMLVVYGNSYEDTPTMGLFIRTLIFAGVLGRLGWYFVGAFLWVSPRGLRCGGRQARKGKRKKISMQKRYITVTPDFRPTALNWALFSLDAHRRPLGETQRKALPKYQPDRLR